MPNGRVSLFFGAYIEEDAILPNKRRQCFKPRSKLGEQLVTMHQILCFLRPPLSSFYPPGSLSYTPRLLVFHFLQPVDSIQAQANHRYEAVWNGMERKPRYIDHRGYSWEFDNEDVLARVKVAGFHLLWAWERIPAIRPDSEGPLLELAFGEDYTLGARWGSTLSYTRRLHTSNVRIYHKEFDRLEEAKVFWTPYSNWLLRQLPAGSQLHDHPMRRKHMKTQGIPQQLGADLNELWRHYDSMAHVVNIKEDHDATLHDDPPPEPSSRLRKRTISMHSLRAECVAAAESASSSEDIQLDTPSISPSSST
ncbi:hypothetical protein J5N97_024578 [Dioscorea zingiberensis]|uniref:Aminotransferase-like plant mobile domain-containing protein n=1 Tax=Dioscorea zingiberensis TaxID=325984 RepID=A0A9D5C6N7_9LILI|nr:hypothetical protein J5N97_024578 [Dioscorea zingiberensis]